MLPAVERGKYERTLEIKEKYRVAKLGKKNSSATKFVKGQRAWNKGLRSGVKPEVSRKERWTQVYIDWRTAVFERDNFTCQVCLQYNGYLHADHLKRWKEYPELRYDVDNGRTLCRACHYYVTFKRAMPANSKWGMQYKGVAS